MGPVTQVQQELWKRYAAVWIENKWVRGYAALVKKAQQVVFVWLWHDFAIYSVGWAKGQKIMH